MNRLPLFVKIASLTGPALSDEFKVEVPAFADGVLKPAQFADAMGCSGDNLSPARWSASSRT